ncbi:MAG TPA: hypothetical protein VGB85_14980 [Nannocystis sp.]|jgi:hypothetical protein
MRRPALALLALLACDRGETIGEYRQRIDPELLAACEPRVAKMREAFARIPREPSYHKTPEDWLPVVHPVGEPLVEDTRWTHRLAVHADGGFGYERAKYRLSAIDQILGEDLVKQCEHARLDRTFEPTLTIWPDRRAPVAELVHLLGKLPQPLRHTLVVYVPADAAPPPPVTPAIAATHGKPLVEELMAVNDAIGEALGVLWWCDPVRAVYDHTSDDSPVTRTVLLDDLPKAILECRCEGIDVETVIAGYWSLYLYRFLRPRVIPLPLTRDPKADALVVPRDATGTDLIALVAAKGPGPYRLVLAPDPSAPPPEPPEPQRGRHKQPRR